MAYSSLFLLTLYMLSVIDDNFLYGYVSFTIVLTLQNHITEYNYFFLNVNNESINTTMKKYFIYNILEHKHKTVAVCKSPIGRYSAAPVKL